jgi:PhoPQ-activated pathogenicity-related protein
MKESFLHHWRTYGFWAPAVRDYEQVGIFAWLRTPQVATLRAIVDPYLYRDRLAMPKYIINSPGDEFFAADSSRLYFDELPGQNFLRYVPNTSHGLDSEDVLTGGLLFFRSITSGGALRRFSWELPPDRGIRLRTVDRPTEVRLWQATNAAARDFRAQTIGRSWTSTVVAESAPGVEGNYGDRRLASNRDWRRRVPRPEGWPSRLAWIREPAFR